MSFWSLTLAVTLLFWSGAMWYSHFATYPLFGSVPPEPFQSLHAAYERGLPAGVYAPFGIMILAVIGAIVVRPADAGHVWLWLAAIAAAGGVVTTAIGAAPLHIKLIKEGLDLNRVRDLLRWNLARLIFALLGAVAAIGLMARV